MELFNVKIIDLGWLKFIIRWEITLKKGKWDSIAMSYDFSCVNTYKTNT